MNDSGDLVDAAGFAVLGGISDWAGLGRLGCLDDWLT